jgi:hypothetical protein
MGVRCGIAELCESGMMDTPTPGCFSQRVRKLQKMLVLHAIVDCKECVTR